MFHVVAFILVYEQLLKFFGLRYSSSFFLATVSKAISQATARVGSLCITVTKLIGGLPTTRSWIRDVGIGFSILLEEMVVSKLFTIVLQWT